MIAGTSYRLIFAQLPDLDRHCNPSLRPRSQAGVLVEALKSRGQLAYKLVNADPLSARTAGSDKTSRSLFGAKAVAWTRSEAVRAADAPTSNPPDPSARTAPLAPAAP